ncbi:BQ2448_3671 [Microbotryum intermedium]|uniref:BQ2448_3671 protein n=1 Tax=Microbotryum intermedium TaxID=269621 RepID=A0A238FDR1_9BASI|nr:BQ2448_3671 [Microbotryum intermedium]
MSKATPSSVQQFSRLGSSSSAHQDQSSLTSSSRASTSSSSSASHSTSFRTPAPGHSQPSLPNSEASTRAQHAWTPSSGVGTDEDLGRFAAFSSAVGLGAKYQARGPATSAVADPGRFHNVNGNPAKHRSLAETQGATTHDFETSWDHARRAPTWDDDDLYHPSHELDYETGEARNGWQDGDEIQDLLRSGVFNEQLEKGWEQDLASDQSRKHHAESTMPKDPNLQMTQGQLSPVTQDLVQKVDALELEARLHLQSLLTMTNESGDDTLAIQAYLSQESYADDVWGLPREIREVLTKVVEEQSQADDSDKNKAFQRLNMVLNHLRETAISTSADKGKMNAASDGRGGTSEDDEGHSYGSALQHVAARRSSQLGPKHSSTMSTPPNGLVQDQSHDFAALHERLGRGGTDHEGRRVARGRVTP